MILWKLHVSEKSGSHVRDCRQNWLPLGNKFERIWANLPEIMISEGVKVN